MLLVSTIVFVLILPSLTFRIMRLPLCLLLVVFLADASADVIISEFLSRNETGLKDEDGLVADWIEIENTGSEAVSLEGWTLTDNLNRPRKWDFPAVSMPAGERRTIFATRKDRSAPDGEWHTNFRLSAPGETLTIFMPDGETIAHQIEAAPQFDDISYGRDGATGQVGYLDSVTPGEPNGSLVYAGPVISEVTHAPIPLMPTDDVVITARVTAREADVREVTLLSRVGYGSVGNGTTMRDDGEGEDAEAGDGLYTAVIGGRTLFGPRIKAGEMVRWAVTATDVGDGNSRLPTFLDQEGVEQSPEFFGTVAEASIETNLPILEWFTNDERNSGTRSGARASVNYMGNFYDNIFVRARGGATNGQSQKFNFNNAFPCFVDEDLSAVGELNLNAQGGDSTHLRQPLAFESYTWIGNASCKSFLTAMRLNAKEDRTGVLIEQVDEDFLERHGFDPLGDLYKMVQRSNLDPVFADTITGIEKKTGDLSDLSNFASLVEGLDKEGQELKAYLFDSMNLPQVFNYLAMRSITQDADDVRKNFYVYNDTLGSGEWSIFPWDKDWTFGITGDGGQHLKHPFFADQAHRKDNANQWNKLYEAVFNDTTTRQMYLRRLRTAMDATLQPSDTPEAELRFENRVDELFAQAQGDVPNSGASAVKRFFPERRGVLYDTYSGLIPKAQEAMPSIQIGDIEFQPGSGSQDEEFIQLINTARTAVDVSGWELDGAVEFTFAEGTVLAASSLFDPSISTSLYVSPNVNAFRQRSESPKGGEAHFVQGPYRGHLSNRGETIILRDNEGNIIAEKTYEGNPTDVERFLLLSEIMYQPADPNGEAEFIELYNASDSVELDLTGLRFTDGIDFDFAEGTKLAPNGYLVIVRNRAAFESVYGDTVSIAGEFADQSRLNNGGERIKLDNVLNSTIFEVRYNDKEPWPTEAAGLGSSLTLVEIKEGTGFEEVESWLASAGTPGQPAGPDSGGGKDLQDTDNDGLVALLEEAFGTSDKDPSAGPGAVRVVVEGDRLVVRASLGNSEDIDLALQTSSELRGWEDASEGFIQAEEAAGEGRLSVWTSKAAIGETTFQAIRLSATRLPAP